MPDDLTPDAFARLTALEQSQELLRRAQFLHDASRRWHAETLDWHQTQLDGHARRMVTLEDILLRQHDLQKSLLQLMVDMRDRMHQTDTRLTQHDAVMAQLQTILVAVLEMLRHRNGR